MPAQPKPFWLVFGGIGSLAVALVHAAAIVLGAPAYRFLGAPQLAPLAEQGSLLPPLLTAGLVLLFTLWALYAFSGAGLVRRLPGVSGGLVAIGAIYSLRGLVVIVQLARLLQGRAEPPKLIIFSGLALALGVAYLMGVRNGTVKP